MFEKITDFGDNCISAAPDTLNGTAAENKAWFDKAVKNVVAAAFNKLIDSLTSADAPQHIGAQGGTLQDALVGLSGEIDTKVGKEDGKVLSDNNYSDEDKAKVDGIENTIIEGYLKDNFTFCEDEEHTVEIERKEGKLYVDKETDIIYRYQPCIVTDDYGYTTDIGRFVALCTNMDEVNDAISSAITTALSTKV